MDTQETRRSELRTWLLVLSTVVLLLGVVMSCATRKPAATTENTKVTALHNDMRKMLSDGIVKQFPDKFRVETASR